MLAAFAWISAHSPEIITALLAIHAAALAIVNLTPTPKDDKAVAKLYHVIEFLAGILTRLAKR
jgi:hypothetical protein